MFNWANRGTNEAPANEGAACNSMETLLVHQEALAGDLWGAEKYGRRGSRAMKGADPSREIQL